MAKKNTRNTKSRIVSAAWKLFYENGYDDAQKGLHDDGSTIILITHDNGIAATAERVVRISDGHIIYDGDREGAFL